MPARYVGREGEESFTILHMYMRDACYRYVLLASTVFHIIEHRRALWRLARV